MTALFESLEDDEYFIAQFAHRRYVGEWETFDCPDRYCGHRHRFFYVGDVGRYASIEDAEVDVYSHYQEFLRARIDVGDEVVHDGRSARVTKVNRQTNVAMVSWDDDNTSEWVRIRDLVKVAK